MKGSPEDLHLSKPHRPYVPFGAGMVAGLALGLFVGAVVLKPSGPGDSSATVASTAVGAKGEAYTEAYKVVNAPGTWSPVSLYWKRLKPFSEAGRAPVSFTTPPIPWDYGGVSHPLPANIITTDLVLRVDVADIKGLVGLSLVNPAGEPIVSQEQSLTEADGERSVFFQVGPKQLPASILIRNYGDESKKPGSIQIKQVSYAALSAFSSEQMTALNTIGLNKPLD